MHQLVIGCDNFQILVVSLALGALGALGAPGAFGQTYPAKPVIVVVPAAPGGPTDTVARMVSLSMARHLGGRW